MDKINCFFAYSSSTEIGNTIDNAIKLINKNIPEVNILSWKKIQVSGKIISDQVIKQIDEAQLFICDLTDMNKNVLFELGYAIAKNKRIWIVLDTNLGLFDEYDKKLSMLTTVAYVKYENANDLFKKFRQDAPYNDLNATIYQQIENVLLQAEQRQQNSILFYLKSPFSTDASLT